MKQRVFGQHCQFCSYCELLSSASVAKLVDTTGFDDVIVDDVIVVATEPLERNDLNQVNLFVEKDLEGLGLELPVSVPEPLASLDRNFRHVAGLVDQVQAVGDLVSELQGCDRVSEQLQAAALACTSPEHTLLLWISQSAQFAGTKPAVKPLLPLATPPPVPALCPCVQVVALRAPQFQRSQPAA